MKPASPKRLLAAALLATLAAAARADDPCDRQAPAVPCAAPVARAEPGVRNDRLAQVVQVLRDGGRRAGGRAEVTSGPGRWLTLLTAPVMLLGCLRRGA